MSEWKNCTLGDLGEVVGGGTPSTKKPEYYGGDIAWITPKDLSTFSGRFIKHGERNITEEGLKGSSARLMPKKTILFSSRAPIGYVAIAENEVSTNQGFKSIVPNDDTDYLFLYYLLKFNKDKIENMGSGTTFKEVSGKTVKAIDVTVPSNKEKQHEIAKILGSLDDKIENNRKINHHLAVQSQAIYQKLIATSEKSEAILSDIATITMGQSPKGDTYNNDKIGLPLLNGAADFRGKITPSKWTSDPKKIVKGGEYIFGVRATIGLTTKVFSEYAIGRGTGSALVKNKLYDEFLYFVLKQLFEFFENSGSGTVYVNISKSDFDNYKFDLPPESLIEQFHFTVKPLLDLIYNNNAENERLAKLRDTLLPKLMSGEITVSQVAK